MLLNAMKFNLTMMRDRAPSAYSRVPNKRGGGVRIIGWGVEMARYNNNRGGVGIIVGVLGKIENSPFLR